MKFQDWIYCVALICLVGVNVYLQNWMGASVTFCFFLIQLKVC